MLQVKESVGNLIKSKKISALWSKGAKKLGRISIHSDVQRGSTSRQKSFSGRGSARIKLPFSGYIANKFRGPTILQLNIEGLTVSKMNVLYHLTMQSETVVILLQETHCINTEKLVLPNYQLAGSFYKQEAMALPRLSTSD